MSRSFIITRAASTVSTGQKTALITGGNSGIGFETAKSLSSQGYNIILGCRDRRKGEDAKRKLLMENPGGSIDIGEFDLADCDSIRNFSKGLLDQERRIDILCNNAGVMACPMMRTKDGFEMQLGVNHLGHFLLTNMLIPLLQKTASETNDVRIINVASAAHIPGRIDFDDLQYERREYKRWEAYSQSKLANVMFSYELAKRLGSTGICSNALHPGVVATELGRYLFPSLSSSDESTSPFWAAPLVFVLKQFLLTPEQGARTSIYLASDDAVRGVTGKYFDSCKPVESNRESYDNTISAKLWDVSAELVKLD